MIYTDLQLDQEGDLKLSNKLDVIPTNSVAQKISIALRWFLGEWVFDESKGTGWFDIVFVKNPDTNEIENMVIDKIMEFAEIQNVTSVKIEVDKVSRRAVIRWRAQCSEEMIGSEVVIWNTG